MPGYVIHLAIGKQYIKNFKIQDKANFLKGCIMPDLLDKKNSHYGDSSSNPNFQKFLNENTLNNDYNQGYLLHLISDYIFYNNYLNGFIENYSDEIYHDYNKLNAFLIQKYGIAIPKEIKEIVGFEKGRTSIIDKDNICSFIDTIGEIDISQIGVLKDYIKKYDILFAKKEEIER